MGVRASDSHGPFYVGSACPHVDVMDAATSVFYGQAIGGFSSSNKVSSAAGQAVDFRPGKTLWIVLQTVGVGSIATEPLITCNDGHALGSGSGWYLTRQASTGTIFLLSDASSLSDAPTITPAAHGVAVLCIVWRAADSHVLVAANGGPLVDYGAVSAPGALGSWVTYIGTSNGSDTMTPLTSARVLAFATWASEATSTQAHAGTYTTGSRYALPSSITTSAIVDFNAARDYSSPSFTTKGSSPVALSVSGSPTLTRLAERRVTGPIRDGRLAIPATDALGGPYTIRPCYSGIGGATDALAVGVEIVSTLYTAYPTYAVVGLYVGGTWQSETAATQQAIPQLADVQLGTGTGKAWEVITGPGAIDTIGPGASRDGTQIVAVRLPVYLEDGSTLANNTVTATSAPSKRVVFFGDSILCGFFAANPTETSCTGLLRAAGYHVACLAIGSESIYDRANTPTLVTQTAAWIAAECDGAGANVLVLNLGTNDYAVIANSVTWPASFFQSAAVSLLTAVLAAVPGLTVVWVTPIQRISPATEAANDQGNTLGDYRSAIVAAAAAVNTAVGRTAVTVVDGSAGAIVSSGNIGSDGIHPTTAGHAQLATSIEASMGSP